MAVIGGGPIGLFAAGYAQLHGLKVVLFDSLDEVGGQPQMLYPFKQIMDIPAYNEITAKELISNLKKALTKQVTIKVNHRVNEVIKNETGFNIDHQFQVRSIIIATGNGAFNPKKFPVKMNQAAEQRVHYFVKDPAIFKGQTIGIFGGGDSALDWALELANVAKVKLIHRRQEFRGLESSLTRLKKMKNVEILTPFLPKEAKISNNQLQITLKEVGSQEVRTERFDQILVAYGFRADNRVVKNWGVNLSGARIKVGAEMKTNLDGIYAAGDVATYPGRVPIIGVGFGETQIAINAIMRELFPEKTLTIHSTSM